MMLALVAFASCTLEADTVSGDGKIEGFWHLESIETTTTDSVSGTVSSTIQDYSAKRVFWSFQRKLLELSDKDGNYDWLYCRFSVADGQLVIGDVYTTNNDRYNAPTTNVSLLLPYGITQLEESFTYSVSGSKLTLTNGNTILHLKKF